MHTGSPPIATANDRRNEAGRGQASPRRRQEDRRADMRLRLIEATLGCLAEHGYVGCTTTAVVERAGVSRGALFHHFVSRVELVATAVWHSQKERLSESRVALLAAIDRGAALDEQLRIVWESELPSFEVWAEFTAAVRTDPLLAEAYRLAKVADPSPDANITPVAWTQAPGDASPLLSRFVVGCFMTGLRYASLTNTQQVIDDTFGKFSEILTLGLAAMEKKETGSDGTPDPTQD